MKEVEPRLFTVVYGRRMKHNGHKLKQEKFKPDIRKKSFFTIKRIKQWNTLPKRLLSLHS